MERWIEKHQSSLIKWMAAILVMLIGYIWVQKDITTDKHIQSQSQMWQEMYQMMCAENAKFGIKIDNLSEKIHKQTIELSVVIEILRKENPSIDADIEWRKKYVPSTHRGAGNSTNVMQQ